jgi:hypothetical protein
LPHLDAVVEAEDELMFITSTQAGEPLSRYLSPIPEDEKGGVQISAPGPPA